MKRLTQLALVVAVGIFPGVSPTPLGAQEAEGRSTAQNVEFGFHGGGGFNRRFDFRGVCRETVTDGCSADFGIFEGDTTDPFFAGAGGGLTVHSGFQFGLRLGVDLGAKFQLEFTWDHVLADLAFEEASRLLTSLNDEIDDRAAILDAGTPRGQLNIYQINLNYHTRATGRVIPYLGAGVGWVQFRNPPVYSFAGNFDQEDLGRVRLDDDTAPAFNFGGGVKIFPGSEHWGFRLDIRQLFSFYEGVHEIRSIEEFFSSPPGTVEPVSADFDQKSIFSHLMVTVGVFARF
ncbi:MAG: hypothetical protein ACE5MH_01245 [Terriglobia bacterium]